MSFDPNIIAGDLLYFELNGKFHVNKVLKVDLNTETYHVLSYFPIAEKPSLESIDALDIHSMHAPIATVDGTEKIGNAEVSEDELQGFYYYLKTTDFKRYCEETGQSVEDIIDRANTCFREGYAFTDEKRYDEAISKYLEAVELYPLFYEAIDNMAIVKMNMTRWSDAIDDFRWSLEIEPKNVLAEFSIGESYMRLGHLQEAKDQFERALELEAGNPLALDFLAKVELMIAEEGNETPPEVSEETTEEEVENATEPAVELASSFEDVTEASPAEEEADTTAEETTSDSLDNYLNTPIEEEPNEAQDTPEDPPAPKKKWWKFGNK